MQGLIIVARRGRRAAGRALAATLMVTMVTLAALVLATPALAADRGALFKVSGEGRTLYLFGTMHVGQRDFYPFEARLQAAVARAPALALELDPALPPEVAARAMQKYGMRAGAGADGMPPALRAPLALALARVGLTPDAVAQYKPWLIATVLTVAEYGKLGYDSSLAVDAQLAALARERRVPVIELESIDAQLALFDGLPLAAQWDFLDETVRDIASGKQGEEARQIAQAWASADRLALDAIAARLEADTTVAGRFMREVLLDGRNGALTDAIVALMGRENNSVAAIGVLHLVGAKSVPALMRAKGLTVERIY